MSLENRLIHGIEPPPLDTRKWRLFIVPENVDLEQGRTLEYMWNLRLQESIEQIKFSFENYPPNQYPRMLIIGCGIGAEIKAAEMLGYKATGVGFLNRAQYEYAIGQGVDMRIMDMQDLRLPNESVDVAYSSQTFEHGLHPWLMCAEVWAVLRRGGRWWINLPTWQNSDRDGPKKEHYMILPPWFMVPLLERSRFRIVTRKDEGIAYNYLCEKLDLDFNDPLNISHILEKRLELGREYV